LEKLPGKAYGRLEQLTILDEDQTAMLRKGLSAVSAEIQRLAHHLLDEWPAMNVQERVASLLALAAALQRSEAGTTLFADSGRIGC
jgi:hypothetical protein